MNLLIDIAQKEGDDPFTRSLRKVLLADEEKKASASTPTSLALRKRVLVVEDDTSKRFKAAAEMRILKSTADTNLAKTQIDIAKAEVVKANNDLIVLKHYQAEVEQNRHAWMPSRTLGCRLSILVFCSVSAAPT